MSRKTEKVFRIVTDSEMERAGGWPAYLTEKDKERVSRVCMSLHYQGVKAGKEGAYSRIREDGLTRLGFRDGREITFC